MRLRLFLSLISLPAALCLPNLGAVRLRLSAGASQQTFEPSPLTLHAAPKSSTVSKACPEGSEGHTVDSVSFFLESGVKMTTGTCAASNATLAARAAKRAVASSPLPDDREPGDECDTPCNTVCFEGTTSPDPAGSCRNAGAPTLR